MLNNAARSVLSPIQRASALSELGAREVDVLVIGGGIVGAGAALDAASRGLTVAVIEARDWASGTSSKSSKLVHGGIRYLEQLDFKLVREALVERGLLLTTLAPHLVKPVPFLYPLQKRIFERLYVAAGMTLYDLFSLSGRRSPGVPLHRHLGARRLRSEMPGLAKGAFIGGLNYYDAQVDDARLVMTLVRTAVAEGALAVSRARVTEIVDVADHHEVTIRDDETGAVISARARHIVNATGVWTAQSEEMIGAASGLTVTMSKGVHFLVDRDKIDLDLGLLLRTEKSVLFVIPWDKHWIVGTTDTPWTLDKDNPAATYADVEYLLEHVNTVLARKLTRADITGVFAGLRPLVSGKSSATTKLSREHVVGVPRPGVAVIAGGKLTTYRVMARDVVDAALSSRKTEAPASRTASMPLLGAIGYADALVGVKRALSSRQLPAMPAQRLVDRYGSLAREVVALVDSDPSLAQLLPGTDDILLAEIAYAVEAEDARHLEDVLTRRTRIAIERPGAGTDLLDLVGGVLASRLDWSEEQLAAEFEQYRTLAGLEAQAASLPNDALADAALRVAPSPVFENASVSF
jgi:glycerol-3-phosphate dehydrogenase